MTERKHTPGPWKAYDAAAYGTHIKHGSMTGQCIAAVHLYQGLSVETYAANARLIAAAPELLEALHSAYAFINREYHDPEAAVEGEYVTREARPIWAKICAAIAKAKGETP